MAGAIGQSANIENALAHPARFRFEKVEEPQGKEMVIHAGHVADSIWSNGTPSPSLR
jgi:hypothetical protein